MNAAVDKDAVDRRDAAPAADHSIDARARTSRSPVVAGIFINYRREDSAGYAGRLADDLSKQFGADRVFMDVTDIAPGADFRKEIERQMAACGVTLVMIGKSWLTGHAGERRLTKADDFVRLEIATALKRDIPVIPVLVDGAAMPAARDLPPDVETLAWRNAVELRHAYWESDLRVLAAALERIVAGPVNALTSNATVPPPPTIDQRNDTTTTMDRRGKSLLAVAASTAIALAVGIAVLSQGRPQRIEAPQLAVAAQRESQGTRPSQTTDAIVPAPSAAPADPPSKGMVIVSAVGLADASAARSSGATSALQRDALADSNRQIVEKALGLLVDRQSLAANYGAFETLLASSDDFIERVVRQNEPQVGKDGFVSVTTQAIVNVEALRRSLNEMSRRERIELIRTRGDPKISLAVLVRDAARPGAPAQPSAVAENIVKERIRSFGFRTWSQEASAADGRRSEPDFIVRGDVTVKQLSMRLEASGIVITKYALTSWTLKCVDRATGEEIYFDTELPTAAGTFASEEQAMKAIGTKIADRFSREFFLERMGVASRAAVMAIDGMPNGPARATFERELVGLPAVLSAVPRASPLAQVYDIELAGGAAVADIVAADVLRPLNAKLGQACFGVASIDGDRVNVVFDRSCSEHPVLARLETYPPAGLYSAPVGRRLAVVKNPDTLRKLTT